MKHADRGPWLVCLLDNRPPVCFSDLVFPHDCLRATSAPMKKVSGWCSRAFSSQTYRTGDGWGEITNSFFTEFLIYETSQQMKGWESFSGGISLFALGNNSVAVCGLNYLISLHSPPPPDGSGNPLMQGGMESNMSLGRDAFTWRWAGPGRCNLHHSLHIHLPLLRWEAFLHRFARGGRGSAF